MIKPSKTSQRKAKVLAEMIIEHDVLTHQQGFFTQRRVRKALLQRRGKLLSFPLPKVLKLCSRSFKSSQNFWHLAIWKVLWYHSSYFGNIFNRIFLGNAQEPKVGSRLYDGLESCLSNFLKISKFWANGMHNKFFFLEATEMDLMHFVSCDFPAKRFFYTLGRIATVVCLFSASFRTDKLQPFCYE